MKLNIAAVVIIAFCVAVISVWAVQKDLAADPIALNYKSDEYKKCLKDLGITQYDGCHLEAGDAPRKVCVKYPNGTIRTVQTEESCEESYDLFLCILRKNQSNPIPQEVACEGKLKKKKDINIAVIKNMTGATFGPGVKDIEGEEVNSTIGEKLKKIKKKGIRIAVIKNMAGGTLGPGFKQIGGGGVNSLIGEKLKKMKKKHIHIAVIKNMSGASYGPGFKHIERKVEGDSTPNRHHWYGVFLFCWVPFFTCNILDALCSKLGADCQPGVAAFILTTWLGYMNSFVNPVIYTIFNPEFRKAFKKIMNIGS